MKALRNSFSIATVIVLTFSWTAAKAGGQDYYGNEDPNKKIIKQGLLGAGTGAIAAGASGGSAGKGALIGAGTNVIGGALLDTLTTPSQPQPPQYVQQQPQYVQQQPQYVQSSYPVQTQGTYQQVEPQRVQYVQQQPAYYPPQEDPNKKILKAGLLGAGTGAIAASASGGSAGKGALIGAGTNVIGGALLDSLMGGSQPQPQPVYYQQAAPQYSSSSSSSTPKKHIIRKYDSQGNVVSEEEVWD